MALRATAEMEMRKREKQASTAKMYINIKLEMNAKLESYLSQIYSHCVHNNSNMILI